ncbi:MAG: Manganese transport system membrane protein MntB [Chlamydiae bacterium]|nr:Manganese transport system membrane protein MntB [Chlamydiota bacterium]
MLEFFIDPILRAPTLGSMLMCFSSGVIGCFLFLQKRSLVGEALSHASYPGVVLGVIVASLFAPGASAFAILLGAFLAGLLGLYAIDRMEKRLGISSDAALCLVLSLFFGVGVCIVSALQVTHALWFRQIQIFLFGQAATMVDAHILMYGGLTLVITLSVILLFRFFEILHFDPEFAKTVGMPTKLIRAILNLLLMVAIVVGMRSVGVILMSAMLIAPAAAARQWTRNLASFLILAGIFGMLSGFFGNALSVWIPTWSGQPHLSLPTGPMIVLSSTAICLFSLFFAPERGFIPRSIRISRFQLLCHQENLLKALYKGQSIDTPPYFMWRMRMKGWIKDKKLTETGFAEGEKLVRLHRLWEVYLVHLGQESDRVHHSAEEMEHVLTPEIEKQLESLLDNPELDPHEQPIPGAGR